MIRINMCFHVKIFSEWLPALQDYEFAEGYCIEMYDMPDKYPNGTADENYYTEIWIPIKKRALTLRSQTNKTSVCRILHLRQRSYAS